MYSNKLVYTSNPFNQNSPLRVTRRTRDRFCVNYESLEVHSHRSKDEAVATCSIDAKPRETGAEISKFQSESLEDRIN